MKSFKKIISLILALALTFGGAIVSYADTYTKGTLTYTPAYSDATEETFYYSDSFFEKSGKVFDGHLLAASYDLTISTFEVRGASYVTRFYGDIGFGDVAVADMLEKPTRDTIGTAIAHKKIGDHNVIAVAIRGEKYDGEWASNFIVGKSGDAKGFSDASAKVIGRIKDYISAYSLENNKLWIVGYSRAGSIADLAGVYINNNLSEFGASADDLYIYAFEPPEASVDDTVYDNIRVVISKNDIVPFVYPANWGMHTNGRIISIGEDQTVTTYTGLPSAEEYGEEKLNELLADSFEWLGSRLTRENYADNLEGPLSDLLEIYFGKSEALRSKILQFFTEDVLDALMSEENKSQLVWIAWSVMSHESDYLYHQLADILIGVLDSLRDEKSAAVITDAELQTLKDSIFPILRALGPVIVDDMVYYDGIDYDEFYAKDLPDLKMDDALMGEKDGADHGFSTGYDMGFENAEFDDTPIEPDDYGPVYKAAFDDAYKSAYAEGFALGQSHAADLAAKGAYDGKKDGAQNGYSEGEYRAERMPHNEYLWEQDWMTDEYIEAYDKAYEEAYNSAYDEGLCAPEYTDPPIPEEAYHIMSIVKNFSAILKNHHPQTNLPLVKLEGHDYNLTAYEDASCTEDGFYSYHCPSCGDDITLTIPAAHTLTHFEAIDATEDADGNIEYWVCEACGLYFADKNCSVVTDAESVVVKYVPKIQIGDAVVEIDDVVYNGMEQRPEVRVILDGKELSEDYDYLVRYGENVLPGEVSVTIVGCGSYEGYAYGVFNILPFSYENDPSSNAKAMRDIVPDENAIYGFRPSETGSLKQYADANWSDPDLVERGREERIAYHESIDDMYVALAEMTAEEKSTEEIARAISALRNQIRLDAYKDDPDGLAAAKARNLEEYGHEEGPLPDELFEKYGSWEKVLEKSFALNMGMDACLGLYDDYYDVYVALGQVFVMGDVNCDSVVNARDVIDLMMYLVGYDLTEFDASLADIDASGSLNARDVIGIMKKAIG